MTQVGTVPTLLKPTYLAASFSGTQSVQSKAAYMQQCDNSVVWSLPPYSQNGYSALRAEYGSTSQLVGAVDEDLGDADIAIEDDPEH